MRKDWVKARPKPSRENSGSITDSLQRIWEKWYHPLSSEGLRHTCLQDTAPHSMSELSPRPVPCSIFISPWAEFPFFSWHLQHSKKSPLQSRLHPCSFTHHFWDSFKQYDSHTHCLFSFLALTQTAVSDLDS